MAEMDETTTRWLEADQQESWRAFLGGTTVLMEKLDRDLRSAHDVSMGEYEILVRLSEAPDHSVRMAELATQVAHSRSRITHTIARLERAGLVTRGQCSEDGRGVCAVLTAHGYDTLRAAAHTHVRGVRDYLVDIAGDEEFGVIGRVMERVRSHLGGAEF